MSMSVPAPPVAAGGGIRARIQRFGGFLAGMVIPNIGAFIAWGLITAFFIPTGWTPNEDLAELVGPMIFFLLPILIGYTGGYLVHGQRGAVVGAIATAGVAIGGFIGTEIGGEVVQTPMFLGAMIMGPLGGWLIKQFDQAVMHRVRTGFEMLVGNFSAGILGAILAIVAYWAIGPTVAVVSNAAGDVVQFLVDNTLLPLASIIVEPAKVLFLNNAINHGILAMIAGGMSGVLVFLVTGVGLSATPSPGSIFAYLAVTPPGNHLGVLAGVAVAAVVSFGVASFMLRFGTRREEVTEEEPAATVGTASAPA